MKKFILFLLFFAAKNIISQNGWTTYTGTIPTGTNIAAETVIFVDNAGNKWIGFSGGAFSSLALAKYDNSSNTWTYWNKTDMGIFSSTISVSPRTINQDNLGNIWFGTTTGLIKYDGTTFTRYTTANGLPHNLINCLEFNNNMLYIGTQNGMSRYDGTTFTNYNVGNSLIPIPFVTDIKAENPNTLWMTCSNQLVKFYINSSFTSTSYTLATTTSTAYPLYKIYIDAAGNKWFSNNEGIIKYDNSNFTYFGSMYPDFHGCNGFSASDITKGPQGGVMVIGGYISPTGSGNCLVEFLNSGTYSVYFCPTGKVIGSSFKKDAGGKYSICGSVSSSTITNSSLNFHSFDFSNYSATVAFGLGSGINNDNYKYLDINQVKAAIMNRGDMWWDLGGTGNAMYEVPKMADPSVAPNAAFAGALWIGGLDASNQLHTSAQTYRQSGNDFWPGPLDTTTTFIDTADVIKYDKIWKVSTDDINAFLYQYSLGNVPLTYTPTADIVNWPAHGTGNKSRNLAPFVDVNSDGIYDWKQGDYPKIKGDQTLYFIFNDNFAPHGETKGQSLGIEVHTMAYAYGCPSVLNGRNELAYTTFYDYKIYNRSNNNYHDVYAGLWNDVDLGYYGDDYVGSSPQDNLGFCYNSDSYDEFPAGTPGYGNYPPACGTTFLKGPLAEIGDGIDNDNDSIVDEIGEECLMNVFDYYNNNIGSFPPNTTNPITQYHYYNVLQGKWKDSTDFTCGGNGYGGTIKTTKVYPWSNYLGNPCGTWTETSAGNLAGDRRYIASAGPFNLNAKDVTEFEFAQVWSVDSFATSNINLASVNKLISDTRKIRSFYSSGGKGCVGVNIGINEKELNDNLLIYPNPANSILNIRSENYLGKSTIYITDILGKQVTELKSNDLYNTSINIEQLNSGVYFLQVKTEKGLIVKKFIKQ
jgi:hypothetical protein